MLKKTALKILTTIAIVVASIFAFICLLFILQLADPANKSIVEGANVSLRTPPCLLYIIKGAPDEKTGSPDLTPFTTYGYHDQTFFGIDGCSVCYEGGAAGIFNIRTSIPISGKDEALFDKIVSKAKRDFFGDNPNPNFKIDKQSSEWSADFDSAYDGRGYGCSITMDDESIFIYEFAYP